MTDTIYFCNARCGTTPFDTKPIQQQITDKPQTSKNKNNVKTFNTKEIYTSLNTLEVTAGVVGPNAGHVELLGDGPGQHALQTAEGGFALRVQRRETLLTGVEGGDVAPTVLWRRGRQSSRERRGMKREGNEMQ